MVWLIGWFQIFQAVLGFCLVVFRTNRQQTQWQRNTQCLHALDDKLSRHDALIELNHERITQLLALHKTHLLHTQSLANYRFYRFGNQIELASNDN